MARLLTLLALALLPLAAAAGEWAAGTVVAEGEVCPEAFTAAPLDSALLARMERGGSRPKGAPGMLPPDSLRYLRLLHRDLQGRTLRGEMVVAASVAAEVTDIFRELYREGYPIESMRLIDDFGADDEASMRANNTSAYCHRTVAGSAKLSLHARGRAIDINPLYNPYVKKRRDGSLHVSPREGRPWADRGRPGNPCAIGTADTAYRLLTARGWEWGGAWRSLKDYQHFEKP